MKKFFLFAATALLSMSMFAEDITVAEAKAKIDASDKGEYTVVGFVTQIDDFSPAYKNMSLWLADEAGGGQDFEVYRLSFKDVAGADVPVVGDKIAVTATLKKYTKSGKPDIYETDKIKSWEIREKGAGERYTDDEITLLPVTVAQALEVAMALPKSEGIETATKQWYLVTGYVASIKTAYDESYGNMTFFMSDDPNADDGDVQAFRAKVNAVKGDKVEVSGYLTRYDGSNSNGDFTSISIKGGFANIVEETAIENTKVESVKAQKVMENGQLFIIRNGVKYNAAGAVVE